MKRIESPGERARPYSRKQFSRKNVAAAEQSANGERASGVKTVVLRVMLLAGVAYAFTFALLALDVAVRVWIMRDAFETRLDVGFLIVYEGMRVLTSAFATVLAAVLAARARVRQPAALMALLLVFLTVAYAKATAYEGFAGFIQERVAFALLAGGTSQELLRVIFAQPAWAVALAGAALLRLSVTYPRPVTAESVLGVGAEDRRGMLRGAAIAGADIGALARSVTAGALERGLLGPVPVWVAGVMLAAGTLLPGYAGALATAAAVSLPLAFAVPAVRGALSGAAAEERARILWFVQAALLAGVAFLVGGALSAVPGQLAGRLSFIVLAVTPTVVLLCLATALVPAGSVEPERALRVTAHYGATALAAVAVFALVQALLSPMFAGRLTWATALALLFAAGAVRPAHALLRAPTAKLTRSPLTPATAAH